MRCGRTLIVGCGISRGSFAATSQRARHALVDNELPALCEFNTGFKATA